MSVSKSVVCLLLLCGVEQVVTDTSSGRSEKVVGAVCQIRDFEKLENTEKQNAQTAATPGEKKETQTIPYFRSAKRDTGTLECYVCDSTTDSVPKKNEGVKSVDTAPVSASVNAKEEELVPEDVLEAETESDNEKSSGNQKRTPTTCCVIMHEETASIINSTSTIEESCDPLSDTEYSFSKTSWIGQFAISADSALI